MFINSLGSISTIVTFVPKELYAVAISTPITPPPMTTIDSGHFSNDNAPVLSMHCGPSIPLIGTVDGTEPVAMIYLSETIFLSPSAVLTFTVVLSAKLPSPSIILTPLALRSACIPSTRRLTTAFFLSITFVKSRTGCAITPMSAPFLAFSYTSALCNRAFVGIHPSLRHVPPTWHFSITVTSAPN